MTPVAMTMLRRCALVFLFALVAPRVGLADQWRDPRLRDPHSLWAPWFSVKSGCVTTLKDESVALTENNDGSAVDTHSSRSSDSNVATGNDEDGVGVVNQCKKLCETYTECVGVQVTGVRASSPTTTTARCKLIRSCNVPKTKGLDQSQLHRKNASAFKLFRFRAYEYVQPKEDGRCIVVWQVARFVCLACVCVRA